jgi:hypothetical protein
MRQVDRKRPFREGESTQGVSVGEYIGPRAKWIKLKIIRR